MSKVLKWFLFMSFLFSAVLFFTGCKKETPLEKAEKQLKKTLEDAKEKLKNVKESQER